ncbi:LCP family protein required for cell wall assembly [Alkalibacillus filiformis]|uniref:LCP family protein required for cell wall assembly n=1 Tax=Alkalibacillus filiformis TaxID=200990 RepID=A0ABU0DWD9_9BACI|nr:LCP family protein [Alkalibacillus filiformis]MDQ0352685.1 LCP family protein required for cell wall assembly [Alkalibacillus filiformis]
MSSRIERKKTKGKRKGLKIALSILAIIFIAIAGYGLYLYKQLDDTVSSMYNPLESDQEKKDEVKERLDNKDAINVLLLGIDAEEGERGRSDSIIFLSLNPNTEEMLMFSIPRDTRVEIPGRGLDKINHAFAFGGADLSVQTVENFLDTTVHFYSQVNMMGLKDGVDALGGVSVVNERSFSQEGYHFEEGELQLSGSEALEYARMRNEDPRGDLGRNDRQQQIINSMVQEALSFESFTRIDGVLEAAGNNVETNMQMDEMRQLFLNYRGSNKQTINEDISGSGDRIGGVWYYIVSEQERSRIQNVINEHMDIQ